MTIMTQAMRIVPIDLGIAGRKKEYVFKVLDAFGKQLPRKTLETPFGTFSLNWENPAERYFSYCFFNIVRYYRDSDLGQYIKAKAAAGKTFLDVGANFGLYSLLARQYGFNTVAVEPEPMHAAFIERNSDLIGSMIPVALSDGPGELPMYINRTNSGATSLCSAPGYELSCFKVPVKTFDSLIADGSFGPPANISLIKVDVEGVEVKMITGMREFFRSGCLPDIWCEVRGDRASRAIGSYRKVRDLLAQFGYQAYEFSGGVITKPMDNDLAQRIVFDLLFCVRQPEL